jgi:predicted dehydrogenase
MLKHNLLAAWQLYMFPRLGYNGRIARFDYSHARDFAMRIRSTRRDFLRTTAAWGASALAAPAFAQIDGKRKLLPKPSQTPKLSRSPNEKLNVALVGVGGRGEAQLGAAGAMENIAALCDVDERNLAAAAKKYPKAKTYVDFRKMLDEMERSIEAVMVSTPDHTHAPAAVAAMRMGKHCYCEKPLAHNVFETRLMIRLAKMNHLTTQMGTQIHAGDNYRRAVELVRGGAIGPIREVRVWCNARFGGVKRPKETPDIPKGLRWDLWLGPAPERPYHPCYHPFNWRNWWDFGTGGLGDFGCHLMDLAFWALDLRHPTTIEAREAHGIPADSESCAEALTVEYEFPARGALPPVKLTWYDGLDAPQRGIPPGQGIPNNPMGVLFIGSQGMLYANYQQRALYPKDKFKDFQAPAATIPASIGHHKEFFEACKNGGPTTCNFDYAGALTEAVLLGAVSYRVGRKLHWDPDLMKAVGCPEADRFIHPPYREGWSLAEASEDSLRNRKRLRNRRRIIL